MRKDGLCKEVLYGCGLQLGSGNPPDHVAFGYYSVGESCSGLHYLRGSASGADSDDNPRILAG